MKRMVAVLLCMALCLSMLLVGAVAETEGDFEYTVAKGEATITEYIGSATEVTIPSTLGGAPVTAIAGFAFYSNAGVGSTATSISIPESVTTLEYGALYGCDDVTAFTVSPKNPSFKVVNGVLFSKDGKTLVRYPAARTDATYIIPSGVITIEHYAFSNCDSFVSINIPGSVITIGDRGFYNCDSLASITIPDSVTAIGDGAFFFCKSLTTVNIPPSVTTIGERSFEACRSLTSVTIGDSVTVTGGSGITIGYGAFFDCDSITTVIIGDGVTTVGDRAFYCCKNLVSLTLGTGLTTIGESAFDGCGKLASVDLPDGVTTIGNRAFFDCESLMAITVPESVTTIGRSTFGYVAGGSVERILMDGFVIKGISGSAAQVYAKENEIAFEKIEKPEIPNKPTPNPAPEVEEPDASSDENPKTGSSSAVGVALFILVLSATAFVFQKKRR